MVHVPLMKLQHISDAVDSTFGLEEIGVFGEEASVDYPSTIVLSLEVRVREANEDLLETGFGEILAKMPHCVCSYNTDMIIFPRILDAIPSNLFRHKVNQFIPYLHSENQSPQKKRC